MSVKRAGVQPAMHHSFVVSEIAFYLYERTVASQRECRGCGPHRVTPSGGETITKRQKILRMYFS